jgi:hypothetical protein
MKCPACKVEMKSKETQYPHSNYYDVMDLHCLNESCPAKLEAAYTTHLCTLVLPGFPINPSNAKEKLKLYLLFS